MARTEGEAAAVAALFGRLPGVDVRDSANPVLAGLRHPASTCLTPGAPRSPAVMPALWNEAVSPPTLSFVSAATMGVAAVRSEAWFSVSLIATGLLVALGLGVERPPPSQAGPTPGGQIETTESAASAHASGDRDTGRCWPPRPDGGGTISSHCASVSLRLRSAMWGRDFRRGSLDLPARSP